ncbi:MAG: hypothetical protein GX443_14335 [Deltaproteobacteria bacterium]|nr:hypothetical protein [Deltaproteobacteria bacterium]
MFSRREFLRELVGRGFSAVREVHGTDQGARFDAAPEWASILPATELSPALLAL